jgi:hypothetical protein
MNSLKNKIFERRPSEAALREFVCCGLSADSNWHEAELAKLWSRVDSINAFNFAKMHEAQGAISSALKTASVVGISMEWSESHAAIADRIGLYMSHLDRIASALAKEGVRLVALKNSGIARGLYQDLGANVMGDVDLLVSPEDFEKAHEVFIEEGFALLGNQDAGRETLGEIMEAGAATEQALDTAHDAFVGGREYALYLEGHDALWFELQTRSIGGRWISEDSEPSAQELMDRSVGVEGSDIRLLCPEDNLLQVCLHTMKHSYVRAPGLRLHTDVDRIVRRTKIDWDAFLADAQARHVKTAVYYSLLIPSVLLRTPIPERVLQKLRPGAVKDYLLIRTLCNADFFYPNEKKWSKFSYLLFVVLLYDGIAQLWLSIFPRKEWMLKKYKLKPTGLWWLSYIKRLTGWIFKRADT